MCALVTRTYGPATASPVATGQSILAAHVNTDLDTLYSLVNGNIENDNIKSGANIAISKTALGTYVPWTAWVPSFFKADGTTALTASVTTARYTQIGKLVTIELVASSNDPAGNFIYFSLPVNCSTLSGFSSVIPASSGGGASFTAQVIFGDTTKAHVAPLPASAWGGSANVISMIISYEAAAA